MILLAATSALAEPGHWRNVFPHRPPVPKAAAEPQPGTTSPACMARLAARGVRFEPVRGFSPRDPACAIADPVVILAIGDPVAAKPVALPGRPLIECDFAERFAGFVADLAAPLARGHLGRPLASIATGAGHECRPRNRVAGAKMSAHGRGIAIDIAAFVLEGGGRVPVAAPREGSEARFLAAVRLAACGAFTTVLGPGADAAHADHLHVDYEIRGRSGDRYRICQ